MTGSFVTKCHPDMTFLQQSFESFANEHAATRSSALHVGGRLLSSPISSAVEVIRTLQIFDADTTSSGTLETSPPLNTQ